MQSTWGEQMDEGEELAKLKAEAEALPDFDKDEAEARNQKAQDEHITAESTAYPVHPARTKETDDELARTFVNGQPTAESATLAQKLIIERNMADGQVDPHRLPPSRANQAPTPVPKHGRHTIPSIENARAILNSEMMRKFMESKGFKIDPDDETSWEAWHWISTAWQAQVHAKSTKNTAVSVIVDWSNEAKTQVV